ncbi:TPA: hypothetical protein QEL76_001603 [Stenotrophomonas maltophilia]|nr:hypothetical protein [Stenotrophomonas maltophilia]
MINARVGFAEKLCFYSLIALGVVGLFSPFSYNYLPAGPIFEVVLVLAALIVFRLPKRSVVAFFIASAAYVFGSFVVMGLYKPAHPLDFAQAYKAFFYVIPLCLFYKSDVFSRKVAVRVLKFLLVAFLIKYSYSIVMNFTPRMGSRPGIYVENNFELIFIILYFFVVRGDLGRRMTYWFLVLLAIVALSGSRSSVLALLVLFYGLYLNRLSLKTFFYFAGMLALGAVAAAIFFLRSEGGGVESIDRYNFMMVFVNEVSSWPSWKFLVGSMPLTPLSSAACGRLAFYDDLFSFAGDGRCYSVILHSYFLRVVFDHGIIGLAFLLWFMWRALRNSGYSKNDVAVFIGIVCSSALSVSAMNSVFVALALALALGLRKAPVLSSSRYAVPG